MATLDKIKQLLPEPAMQRARDLRDARVWSRSMDDLLQREAGDRFRSVDPGPAATSDVVSRTALMKQSELAHKSRTQVFLSGGRRDLYNFLVPAISAGLNLQTATAAFELGSGGARLLRHLRSIEGLSLTGSDLIEENVSWCQTNLPDISFHQNQLEPPLTFASDNTFDLAFAYSVFTHIPFELQGPWVGELARVLKPGGIATVTILGQEMADFMMNDEDMDTFHRQGHFTMGPDHPRVSESSRLIGSWDVFMNDEVLGQVYGEHLEVLEREPGNQSVVTLRKRS